MLANYCRALSRLPLVCSLMLLTAALSLHAQTIPNVTGTITSSESFSQYGFLPGLALNLQASGFSLDASIGSDTLNKFGGNGQIVTFNPSGMTSDVTPLLTGSYNANSGTLTYNGATYHNLQIALNVKSAPAVVNNLYSGVQYQYLGAVQDVPFSLAGVVTVYNTPPGLHPDPSNPPLFSINFSGGGLYSGTGTGTYNFFPASSAGMSTYQLLASPIDFRTDTYTQGNWSNLYGGVGSNKYGGEGYAIANGPSFLPGYAAVSVNQASTYTYASQTSDVRALQNGFDAPTRIASAYYGNNFNFHVDFTDNNPHSVSLYLLDFDNSVPSETLTVRNADTGAILDTETIANFQNGIYATWNLQGNVTITITGSNGGSGEVSGIFFGPPATVLNHPINGKASFASFRGWDPYDIQGAWQQHYGSAGYTIANGPSSAPTTGTLNVTGAVAYTYAAQTTDPRALELNPQGTIGIASAYTQYQATSFHINVNTLGTPQLLSLYLLDWDHAGRTETITLTDASSGIVLDTENASYFQSGDYISWLISGNIVVTVTPSGNSSPVVSGIFLN